MVKEHQRKRSQFLHGQPNYGWLYKFLFRFMERGPGGVFRLKGDTWNTAKKRIFLLKEGDRVANWVDLHLLRQELLTFRCFTTHSTRHFLCFHPAHATVSQQLLAYLLQFQLNLSQCNNYHARAYPRPKSSLIVSREEGVKIRQITYVNIGHSVFLASGIQLVTLSLYCKFRHPTWPL